MPHPFRAIAEWVAFVPSLILREVSLVLISFLRVLLGISD